MNQANHQTIPNRKSIKWPLCLGPNWCKSHIGTGRLSIKHSPSQKSVVPNTNENRANSRLRNPRQSISSNMLLPWSMDEGHIKLRQLIKPPRLPSWKLRLRLEIDEWMMIGHKGEGPADQVGSPPSHSQHASKKLPFSCRVVGFSRTQPLAVVLHRMPARRVLLLQDSTSSEGRCVRQNPRWKRGVKEAEDWSWN